MAATIQDITNPDFSYEERARLRKERRGKKATSGEVHAHSGRSSPLRPFRTQSPTVDSSVAPTLGYPSEYAYMASHSPRSSPSPSHKRYLSPPMSGDNLRDRTISEPIDINDLEYGNKNRHVQNTEEDDSFDYSHHVPTTSFPYDSRTPRLTRGGGGKKSNVIYRRDLDDFNKQDITVVMFPRDATLERSQDTIERTPLHRKLSDDNSAKKKGMVIVPSTTPTPSNDPPIVTIVENTEETKAEVKQGSGRKISKTFSFLSKKDKGEKKKKTSKENKHKKSTEKRLSGGGLSGISMPNLYTPGGEEAISPESSEGLGSKMKIFRRKQDKKSNVQRTSWTFQPQTLSTEHPLNPTLSLENIAESPTGLPTYEMLGTSGSMDLLNQYTSEELEGPITVFGSSESKDDDEDDLPSFNRSLPCLVSNSNDSHERSPSPISIGSITIDIPDLPDLNKSSTPLPTPNEITGTKASEIRESEGKDKSHDAKKTNNPSMNNEDVKKDEEEQAFENVTENQTAGEVETERSFSRNLGSRRPLRKPSLSGSKDSPGLKKRNSMLRVTPEPPSTAKRPMSISPSRVSINSNSSYGDSPMTTPTNARKKILKSPVVRISADKGKKNVEKKNTDGTQNTTPTNSPMTSHPRSSGRIRKPTKGSPSSSPLSSPVASRKMTKSTKKSPSSSPLSSPVASRKMKGTKSPQSSPTLSSKSTRSTLATSSLKNSPKSVRKSVPERSDGSPKDKTKEKSKSAVESPVSARKRRLGITSITSPLSEEKKVLEVTQQPADITRSKIIPKRPAPSPPIKSSVSKMDLNVKEIVKPSISSTNDGLKPLKVTTPIAKRKSQPAMTTSKDTKGTTSETYVYQSRFKKSSAGQPVPSKESQTYKYTTGSLGKKISAPSINNNERMSGRGQQSSTSSLTAGGNEKSSGCGKLSSPGLGFNSERSSGRGKLSSPSLDERGSGRDRRGSGTNSSQKLSSPSLDERGSGRDRRGSGTNSSQKLSAPGLKKPSIDNGTPSRLNKSLSKSSLQRQQKLSLVEMSTQKGPKVKVLKSSSEERRSKSPENDELSTLDILKPLDSFLTLSTEQLTKNLPSPPMGSMLARPFSPISPQLSEEDEGDISLTPEVPLDREDELTYIYRKTLLRKTSGADTERESSMSRTASNKSLNSDSGRLSFSRTTSPRKSSLSGSPSRQSKKSLTRSPSRKGNSITGPPSRKNSQTLARKPSSGVSRENVNSATLGRPRSASQVSTYQSLRRSSRNSLAPPSALSRQSLRNKKISADSISTKNKPPSGMQMSKRSHPNMALTDLTDGNIALSKGNSNTPTTEAVNYSKPKPIVKANSSAGFEQRGTRDRKSIKISKSVDSSSFKPKPVGTKSAFLKPPSGSTGTLGRSSLRNKTATESSQFQNPRASVRMSRRSSSGTVKKVSQSNSPLHSGSSPAHRTLTRTQSKKDETEDAFEYVSSMADKTKLSSVADHKRQVRPRTKYRPSPGHLQMLSQRKDVSTDMDTSKQTSEPSGADPNAYATYMGKKKLDKTALAGLAAKLDFTTVQLRKTGIVEQMMSDGSGAINRTSAIDDMQNSYGVQLTTHPIMLLMIKGRKNMQTRLVEPSAMSINSGDIFILVSENDLFLWQGKEANVLEKARANDIVNRIYQKRELGCRAKGYTHLDDDVGTKDLPRKHQLFWEQLNGKPTMKQDINTIPADEVYEKGVSCATKVYQFVVEGEVAKFVIIHEDSVQQLKIALLETKKIFLFDFCSEVYVWMGKRSSQSHRKVAMTKARKHYDGGYIPPVFSNVSTPKKIGQQSPNRQSGRFHSKIHQRHGTLQGSMRKKTLDRKPSKGSMLIERPSWSLFSRINESSETILFREKFSDWPEPGRIIKMRGHESSGEVIKPPPMPELQPADVHQMLKPLTKFEGMRLEGENIHRGHGNYKVSRSSFACNRVRSQKIEKYLVKDSDNILLPEKSHGIFYSGEGYVFRWSYIITVVKELEGLTPGAGMFARDRQYQKELNNKKNKQTNDNKTVKKDITEDGSSDEEVNEEDEESKRVLESGGRDRVAYFFWQGEHASINEKGAAAVITVEMDKERAPQIRVTQSKEHPAFLQLFRGSMIVLYGKSEKNPIDSCPKGYRLYAVLGNAKKEACLVEINVENHPLFYYTRSRGCYIIQHKASSTVYVWMGSKATESLRGVAGLGARNLKRRLDLFKVVKVTEGSEPKELSNLMGGRTLYHSLLTSQVSVEYTPRLFHLSSSSGWFIATEETHISRPDSIDTPDPFPFLQEDIYNATQPGLFLLDANTDIYLWMGWWPVQKNKLLQEKNAFSGLAQSRWAKDKKLALETALMYAEGCKRTPACNVYVVNAGTEHIEFTNLFPIWNEKKDVQEIVGSAKPSRSLAEKELAKYNRKTYTLKELIKRPEEVDASKLEVYLSDEEFEKLFKMSRDAFAKMLLWKQVDLKKKVGLF